MSSIHPWSLVFAPLVFVSALYSAHADPRHRGGILDAEANAIRHLRLTPEPQEEVIRYEGGAFRVWWRDVPHFSDRRIEVSEITFEENGLLLPQYADADGISYVLEGSAIVGVVSPSQGQPPYLHIRRVEQGDVVAIPKGVVFWWYNEGLGNHKIFCASDTTAGVNPGLYHQFSLAGEREERFGGLLHGFSGMALATAWGVDEETVILLMDGQKEACMIKAPGMRLPDPKVRDQSMGLPISNFLFTEEASYLSEFRYNLDKEYPDDYVKTGGWAKIVNQESLPILKLIKMSAMKVSLEKGAVEGPLFFTDAHQMIYVISGSGRIEVSENDSGEEGRITASRLQEGSVVVVPKFLPSMRVASDDEGLSYIVFLTSSRPFPSYIAGRSSVLNNIPLQVLAASFDVDEGTLSAVLESRKHVGIFPSRVHERQTGA